MVDHPADSEPTFRSVNVSTDAPRPLGRVRDWLDRLRTGQLRGRWSSLVVLAGVATLVWLAALGAYGVGFVRRLSEAPAGADDVVRLLPTLDMLFFAFAVAGPLAMLWIVVLALRRADRMSDALAAQGDSALALAATISNLNDSVEELNASTLARLEGLPAHVDKVMLETSMMVDQRVSERLEKITAAFEASSGRLDNLMDADIARLSEAVGVERAALATLREGLTRRAEEMLGESTSRIEAGLQETRERVAAELSDALSRQTAGLVDGDTLVRDTLHRLSQDVASGMQRQATELDETVAKPMRRMQQQLDDSASFITSNPPPSPDALASLLGEAAKLQITPERQALVDALDRVARIEAKADALLTQIDRTSRLNPLMGPGERLGETPPAEETGAQLPFGDLPKAANRGTLNWTAVVRALDGALPDGGARQAVANAAADPDVARVRTLSEQVASALSDERVYVSDLRPEPAPAAVWAAFAEGAHGAAVAPLGAAFEDDVVLALTRSRLRNDADFHALALRLISAYGDLLSRSVADIGADSRLVEMSDTPPGRAVQLLLCVLRPFASEG